MGKLLILVGFFASAITILQLAFGHHARRAVARIFPAHGLACYKTQWTMADINDAISTAKSEVAILQTWLPTLNDEIEFWARAERSTTFRVLLASHTVVRSRLEYRKTVPLTDQNLERIEAAVSDGSANVEIRFYEGLPFGPVYIVDDIIYWGLYFSNRDSMKGPRFKTRKTSRLGRDIIESYETMWNALSTHSVDEENDLVRKGKSMSVLERPSVSDDTATGELEIVGGDKYYQRYCEHCHTYLAYKAFGPGGSAIESYCPNPACPRFNIRVEDVPLN